MKNRSIHFILFILLFSLLAGCATKPSPTEPSVTQPPTVDAPATEAKGGTLYITVNPVIAVTYDPEGRVTAVTAVTEDAEDIVNSYQNYVGKECTEVVSELVTKIGEAGYLSDDSEEVTIALSFEEGSGVPSEDFVADVEQQVQEVVTDNCWQGSVSVEEPSVPFEEPTTEPTAEPTSAPGEPSTAPTAPSGETTTVPTSPVEDPSIPPTAPNAPDQDPEDPSTAPTVPGGDVQDPGTEPTVAEPATPGTIPDGANEQPDGTYTLTEELDDQDNPASGDNAVSVRTSFYSADGKLLRQETVEKESGEMTALLTWEYDEQGTLAFTTVTQYSDGTMRFYEECYPNGNPKSHKMWNESGALMREFEAFHGENNNNGISIQYGEDGTIQYRDTFGNPDGSPDTMEMWDADGTYYVNYMVDGNPVGSGYTTPDGNSVTETYDYEAGTIHVISKQGNSYADTVTSMETGEIISGYIESTVDNGNYHYVEYAGGVRIKLIMDGSVNPLGYTYRETSTYYPNGQQKTAERYFYADGGHIYVEFDESGNVIFSEDTTECNYGEVG